MKWLQSEIAVGFQKLVTLRLKNTPSEEVLLGTVGTWLDALIHMPCEWDEKRDRPRVTEAFRTLCRNMDTWPSIKDFIEALPCIPAPKALEAPEYDRDLARKNIQKLKQLIHNKPLFKRI